MLKRLLPSLVLVMAAFSAVEAQCAKSADDPLYIDPKHQKEIDADVKEGDDFVKQVEKQEKVSKDQDMQDRVQRIGAVMAGIANKTHLIASWGDKRYSKFNYDFKVLEGKDVNAFSLPGGHIYVYEGLMKFVQSDDELAAVLGHEVSHAALRHIATLQHEMSKDAPMEIAAVLATILAGSRSGYILPATQLLNQAHLSGWSVKAENAADYGGFQLMCKSPYNPTACLTINERLVQLEHNDPSLAQDWGIFTTHPPSQDRVQAIRADLTTAKIPIQRSLVTTSFTTSLKKVESGVQAWFGTKLIYTFTGDDAETRAESAQQRLNSFFDGVPALYDVKVNGDSIYGGEKVLISIEPSDAQLEKVSVSQLASRTRTSIQNALYNLAYQVQPSLP